MLLHGEAGIGKQRLALWLAQRLLCEHDDGPCGACGQCRFSAELSHPDLLWAFPRERLKDSEPSLEQIRFDIAQGVQDRLKNGGLYSPPPGTDGLFVATIRLLVHQASVTPAMARRKVFVVGDAERMVPQEGSEQAANAFLKLLEEPPADTFIILTTGAPGALLPTIRSRVVSMRVAPVAESSVRAFVEHPLVVEALGGTELPKGADELVELAAGAPGRLLSSTSTAAASVTAKRMLDAALSGDRARLMKAALSQGSSGARGTFSDVLDALTIALHRHARSAVETSNVRGARNAYRAVEYVEECKAMATGNVNPQLITASLLQHLSRVFAS